jgi:hypothetical protein
MQIEGKQTAGTARSKWMKASLRDMQNDLHLITESHVYVLR